MVSEEKASECKVAVNIIAFPKRHDGFIVFQRYACGELADIGAEVASPLNRTTVTLKINLIARWVGNAFTLSTSPVRRVRIASKPPPQNRWRQGR